MVIDALVPDVLVKLIALTVTAHSSTESEGVSPMFTSTAVDAAGGVTGGVEPVLELEPLPHPIVPAVAIARVSNVYPAHLPVADCFMVFLPTNPLRNAGPSKIDVRQLCSSPAYVVWPFAGPSVSDLRHLL
jgi:hypothetical protein